MAYLHSSGGEPISPRVIQTMGLLLDLTIPEEDLEALSVALRDQLASFERIEALTPAVTDAPGPFDPRWHD